MSIMSKRRSKYCQEQISLWKMEVKLSCGLSCTPGGEEVAMRVMNPRVSGVGVKEGSDLFKLRLRGIINVVRGKKKRRKGQTCSQAPEHLPHCEGKPDELMTEARSVINIITGTLGLLRKP